MRTVHMSDVSSDKNIHVIIVFTVVIVFVILLLASFSRLSASFITANLRTELCDKCRRRRKTARSQWDVIMKGEKLRWD